MESKFLHNHPQKEKMLGLDEDHVIVDREDWEKARQIIKTNKRVGIIGRTFGFEGSICGIDEAKTICIAHEHVVRYPDLPGMKEAWAEADYPDRYLEYLKATLSIAEFRKQYYQEPEISDKVKFGKLQLTITPEILDEFQRMNEQMTISAENIKSLAENLKVYERENNPKKEYKGHERPYKYHR